VEYQQIELVLGLTADYVCFSRHAPKQDPAWDQSDPPIPTEVSQIPLIPFECAELKNNDFESDSEIYKPYNIPSLASPQLVDFEAPPKCERDLNRESVDTLANSIRTSDVREQVTSITQQVAPEHCHWLETYWVARGNKRHLYYRYCWMVGRKISRCHIPGGHIHRSESLSCCHAVREAIASNCTPQEIQNMIRAIRNSEKRISIK